MMNQPETSLENRVLALETRVLALEKSLAAFPQKSRQAKSFAKDASESHLNFRMDLLSLIEDHVEVLKLIHNMVGPTDRNKNKLVMGYIHRAETRLGQFQARLTQWEDTRQRFEKVTPTKPPVPPAKPRGVSLLKSATLDFLWRSVSWSNR